MHAVKTPDSEPIPGYRLLEPLGHGGYGEVWKCVAPGGLAKAIKFVAAGDSIIDVACAATQELHALQHIKEIRHPFLLSIERVEVIDGELVIVMELADRSLHDVLSDYRRNGRPGIPRDELLGYLREAAEVLDLLNLEYGLQHLDVKPRNLFVVGRHVKVADFGLVNSLAEIHGSSPQAVQLGVATPLYSSPESFLGRITLYSDQYSLAVSYCEMLTGVPPFDGKSFRQLALQHTAMAPELGRLAEPDCTVVARALAKEPAERFPSCLDFVNALERGAAAPRPAPTPPRPIPSVKSPTGYDIRLEKVAVTPPAGTVTPPPAPVVAGQSRAEVGSSLSGYRFLQCLARMPIGEVWKARDSAGHRRLIQLVFGCQTAEEAADAGAVGRLTSIRHYGLEPFTVVRDGPNRIALVLDERDGTLADRLAECQASGLAGVPREELFGHLWRAAETLDELYADHGLQHLTLNPRTLLLDRGQLRIGGFGLAALIWLPAGLDPARTNARYAPPELFEGRVVPSSDQYSLALTCAELLTGLNAFRGLSQRQLSSPRLRGQPNLDLLPAPDRAAVARAVDPDPARRFPNCTDFVAAVESAATRLARPTFYGTSPVQAVTPSLLTASAPLSVPAPGSGSRQYLQKLLGEAMGGAAVRELKGFRFRVVPGTMMEHEFTARFVPGTLTVKLEGFRRHWLAKVINATDREQVYHITPPQTGIQRWLGRGPTLSLCFIHAIGQESSAPVPIKVTIEPLTRSEHLLEELGPRIIDSVRQFLHAEPERRDAERFRLWKQLRVLPVFGGDEVGEGVVAQALDVSRVGLGFFLPCRPPAGEVLLELGAAPGPVMTVPAVIVRADACPDGRYLVGVKFEENNAADG
jgi:serine/threonine protein kinase